MPTKRYGQWIWWVGAAISVAVGCTQTQNPAAPRQAGMGGEPLRQDHFEKTLPAPNLDPDRPANRAPTADEMWRSNTLMRDAKTAPAPKPTKTN